MKVNRDPAMKPNGFRPIRNGVRLRRNDFHRLNGAGQQNGRHLPSKGRISLSARRLFVRKIKEVLRLKFDVGLGLRQIARSCSLGLGTAHEFHRLLSQGILAFGALLMVTDLARRRLA
jgi:hypothetical protein